MDYQPEKIEQRHYERWEDAGYFKASGNGTPYCIVIPPPNVTGTLHMGHAFQHTIMDALTRYHRMKGCNTLWQMGTDHAGIATQMVVERLLNAEGKSKHELGRDAFINKVWEWKELSGNIISHQMRRLGASVDWTRERFTMDAELCKAVTEEFVQLYEAGQIYKGERLVNWDPVLHTALSDLEVISEEEEGKLWRFRYPLSDSKDYLVVATTRPETMLGDTAVAVHPEDERYASFVGRTVQLPLCDRTIPILADHYVDPEFGTGCVKITPAHDFNDYELGKRHNLPTINIFDKNATLNDAVPAPYRGLDRLEARNNIIADMKKQELLDGIDNHTLVVPRGDRSGEIVEPFLTDQWYVRTTNLSKPAIEAVECGDIQFVPGNWSKTYFEWMRNIEDWCISRQLWWGHRIPAWYDNDGKVYVGRSEDEVRKKYNINSNTKLRQDEDVLDTWFSSALWPFSTLGWPSDSEDLETFYPTNVLVTGFDIIFFWVARMIMMGLEFTSKVPFKEVYMTGLIRDHSGQKMSKSKGNILDPLDIVNGATIDTLLKKRTEGMMQPHLKNKIEKLTRKEFPKGIPPYGADALRLTLSNLATTGRDINLDMGRVEGNRNFCNKLWNAAKFVFSNIDQLDNKKKDYTVADQWIYSRLGQTIESYHKNFAEYRFDLASQSLYDFIWHEYCDWYLELSKSVLNDHNSSISIQSGTQHCLTVALGTLLKLLHPFAPFITEELWLQLCKKTNQESHTLMLEDLPEQNQFKRNLKSENEIEWIQNFIKGVRQIRGETNISPGKHLSILISGADDIDKQRIEKYQNYLYKIARIENIDLVPTSHESPDAATALVGKITLLVPLKGIINLEAEKDRLIKQQTQIEADLFKAEHKLSNPKFTANAPKDVIEKQKNRTDELKAKLNKLLTQLNRLKKIKNI
ncbi:MAG: valine--tRNA ligase [Rhodospirillaceae bacterium]|nr:valine--tRNA ligase [Rhodospirillaceae bacterium]